VTEVMRQGQGPVVTGVSTVLSSQASSAKVKRKECCLPTREKRLRGDTAGIPVLSRQQQNIRLRQFKRAVSGAADMGQFWVPTGCSRNCSMTKNERTKP